MTTGFGREMTTRDRKCLRTSRGLVVKWVSACSLNGNYLLLYLNSLCTVTIQTRNKQTKINKHTNKQTKIQTKQKTGLSQEPLD